MDAVAVVVGRGWMLRKGTDCTQGINSRTLTLDRFAQLFKP